MADMKERADVQSSFGKVLDGEWDRDAIHIAVAPVTAGTYLAPGQDIGFIESNTVVVGVVGPSSQPIGIVDPFLRRGVYPGTRFWMFLYPNTITALRHDWTHPAFGAEPARYIRRDSHMDKSQRWIAVHADLLGLSAAVLMEDAEYWLVTEEIKVQRDSERWRDNFNPTEFWHHYEIVTGKPVPNALKQSFYCCTC